ncbi:hypothetical protein [Desulfosporosinus lacus]|uniref:Uncharacterized protein n=1 Tax=Desulfosporosinus lacus DSM 15449 TaxID=1121420 RepID=A0A1M6DLJ4_9FIRM|nr:hypothetical protein [Desulfosporosinus lacus]SHI74197.1 hypothetical protein SAMN02746098_04560 [Desulfosporosinus lacus DSM 15449]
MSKKEEQVEIIEPLDIAVRQTNLPQISNFEASLMGLLQKHGLPSQSILVPISQRVAVFNNIGIVVDQVEMERRSTSVYISKFIAAVASGLFDAALNYLWDETISDLRRRVAQYDLSYFYDNAVSNPEKRKKLDNENDLVKIDDNELIHGAREIELISELGFKHLDFIRYMRNWASAAHPNQNEITGLQLVSWLETCIREVISLPLSNIVVEIKRLLSNIKTSSISDPQAKEIAAFFMNLTQDQVNNLASGFYGIYTRTTTDSQTRQNIHNLLPFLWGRVDEKTRQQFGIKYGKFVANNDQDEKTLARQFLDLVSGASYIPDDLRAVEIQAAVENLTAVHWGHNNFYNEPPFARELKRLVGQVKIPKQINHYYVLGLVEVFLTNGNGVAWNAEVVYIELLGKFDPDQALLAILSFDDERISSLLQFTLCQKKFKELLNLMKQKVSSPAVKELIIDIETSGRLDRLRDDHRIREKVDNILRIIA